MSRTGIGVAATVLGTLGLYTAVANVIPQVESEVPAVLELGAGTTPEELVAAGRGLYEGAGGCTACHGLGTRAPDLLDEIGLRCGTRREGLSCKAYLYESMTDPGAYIVEGFQPIMPDMRRTLSSEQIWAVVAFLESQGGRVTVTAEDYASAQNEPATRPPSGPAGRRTGVADGPALLEAHGCLACHRVGGAGGVVGPALEDVARTRDAAYIRRAILQPDADTASGFEAFAGTMPRTFGDDLTATELETLVAFLVGLK
ncbi:MAG: c-type cytochrome [Gemmatimonadota bacterium]